MEERGRVRRGLFVEGIVGAQFALPGAVDRLRAARAPSEDVLVLAADDPALPWGAMLPWPTRVEGSRPRRVAGASVVLVGGAPVLYLEKGERSLLSFARAEEDPSALHAAVRELQTRRGYRSLRLGHVDGEVAARSPMAPLLLLAGFARDQDALVLERS
jgi:ATP-dependent Lhr-like helicase